MSTIVTRSGKGSSLTNNEVDANFTNLNTDKAELSGATFTGVVRVPNGSTSAPSFSFSGDTNTGIYSAGGDNIGFAIAGSARAFISGNQFNMTGNGIFSGNGTFGGTLGVTGVLTTTAATVFNGGFASNAASTITSADNLPQLTLTSTDADAAVGPVIKLYRNSASPADNDLMGKIQFSGEDDAGNDSTFGTIIVKATDVSNGAEDASMIFSPVLADTFPDALILTGAGATFNAGITASNAGVIKASRADNARSLLLYTDNNNATVESDTDPLLLKSAAGITLDSAGTTIIDVNGGNHVATFDANGLALKTDDARLLIEEADGTNIAFVGDLTGAGQGGAFYYNHGGTATIQLMSYEASTIGHGLTVGGAVTATGLTVNGVSQFDNYGGATGKGRIQFGNSGQQFIEGLDTGNGGSGSYLKFGYGSTTALTINSSGQLLLGTTTSDSTLSVDIQNTSASSNNTLVRIKNTAGSEDSGLIIDGNNGGQKEYRIGVNTVADTSDLTFSGGTGYRFYTGSTERMRLTSTGVDVTGTVTIPDYVIHGGNTSTKFGFGSANTMNFISNGSDRLTIANSYAVFNDAGSDYDFRVESSGNSSMLVVDGGGNFVDIGGAGAIGGQLNILGDEGIRGRKASNYKTATMMQPTAFGYSLGTYAVTMLGDTNTQGTVSIGYDPSGNTSGSFSGTGVEMLFGPTMMFKQPNAANNGYITQLSMVSDGIVINDTGADLDFRVESDNNTHALFVDGGTDRVSIGGVAPENDTLSVITTGTTGSLRLVNSNTGAGATGLIIQNSSASPADNDGIGTISFIGKNDAGNDNGAGYIKVVTTDVTNGSYDSSMEFETLVAGGVRSRIKMTPTETVFNDNSVDVDFRVESNGNANMIATDAANNRVGIGRVAVSNPLEVAGAAQFFSGIQLGGSGSANNMDDYEEGSWTPAGSNFTIGTINSAKYRKIGNQVTVVFWVQASSGNSSPAAITGLPFTSATNGYSVGTINLHGGNPIVTNIQIRVSAGTTIIAVLSAADVTVPATSVDSGHIIGTLTYFTDS